ncbi:MAG TPA: PAS domain S-box protein [Verrucomicrobiae bacterium]|nr:PAS domain S-box protein [Verrucomicrobiae bacterium]
MLFRDLPIRRKLVGLISLISLSTLIAAGVVMLAYEFGKSRRAMAGRLSTIAKIISANSSAALVLNQTGAAHETLSALQAEPEIRAAALYDKYGRLFARYPAGMPAEDFPTAPPLNGPRFGKAFTLVIPVHQSRRPVGTLYLKADYRNLSHRMFVYGIVLALVLAGSGVLTLFLSNRFESRISGPLLQLASVATSVSQKQDYSVRATKSGADELGTLTDAFNSMLAQIQKGDAALRDSEHRFRMIADNIAVLAWTADELGVVTWYNKRWYDYTGLTVEEARGAGWERLHHPEHRERVKRGLQEAYARKTPWEDTFPLKGADGQYRWFLSRAVPICDEAGNIVRWFGTNVDVTEMREVERSVAHLAAIVESSHDAIISKTLEGVIRTWNRGAEQMFGYTAAEAIGQSITLIIPSERHFEEESILERQRCGESIEHFETVRVKKDGTQIEVSLSISPLRDGRGRIVGVSKIARDITEKKRSERALQSALIAAKAVNRAKDEFLAALSHELRTPLMPVMFTISGMQQDPGLSSSLRNSLAVVRRNLEIQVRMINDLIDLSRIRANRLELIFEVIDLHETITRAFEVCRSHQKFPELIVELKLGARNHFVRADADRMQQVFWNLIQNAIKFTPAGGEITIRSYDREDRLGVSVADTGCGIEPEVLGRIFQPFEQGGRKSKESLQGLGLGLAIAQRIVTAHGGSLTVASEGAGQGATFILELQAVHPPPAVTAAFPYQPELINQ